MIAEVITNGPQVMTRSGAELGAVIAVVCSWERNRSILWAIIAGALSWLYVIYFFFTRGEWERPKH